MTLRTLTLKIFTRDRTLHLCTLALWSVLKYVCLIYMTSESRSVCICFYDVCRRHYIFSEGKWAALTFWNRIGCKPGVSFGLPRQREGWGEGGHWCFWRHFLSPQVRPRQRYSLSLTAFSSRVLCLLACLQISIPLSHTHTHSRSQHTFSVSADPLW